MLSMVVLSHRHNKEDSITKKRDRSDQLDFTLVRDTMYKYSKKAQDRFFSNHYLAFLFISFASSEFGLKFICDKFADKGQEYI